jgi:Holliday junction DNA helicase RuvB
MAIDALRPDRLSAFTGQDRVIKELKIILKSADRRGELCDHVLLSGPPGLGKTTLASIIATELKLPLFVTAGPALEKPSSLINILTSLNGPSVVFIDEVHRLPRIVEETLYPAMEDGCIDLIVGEGVQSRSIRLPLKDFVLVAATTQSGLLSAPLRDRFGFSSKLSLYNDEDLEKIVTRSANILGINLVGDAAKEIATRSRGTPRIANTWLRRVRDWAVSSSIETIDFDCASEALEAFHIDTLGLDHSAREYLRALIVQFQGGPVGLGSLAAAVGEPSNTLEEVYEPYLLRSGLLARTSRGRVATELAYKHLNITPNSAQTTSLTLQTLNFTDPEEFPDN